MPGVQLEHRYGGHGGVPTEWEIHTDDPFLKKIVLDLPVLPGVQSTRLEHENYHTYWIILEEGISARSAAMIAGALAMGNPNDLLEAVQNASKEFQALPVERDILGGSFDR